MAYLGLETIRRGKTAECVKDIFTLHFPDAKRVLDCTYGAGRFWNWDHKLDVVGVDIDPPLPVSVQADYRQLPFEKGSFDVMCFDPPFLFGKSKGLRRIIGTKRFFMGAERTGKEYRTHSKNQIQLPKNPADLLDHYKRIFEQRSIALQGIILKGQNLVTGKNRDYWMYNVMKLASDMGMGMPTDYLIQHSPAHRMSDPRWLVQRRFRTAECYYLIYKYA